MQQFLPAAMQNHAVIGCSPFIVDKPRPCLVVALYFGIVSLHLLKF